MSSKSKVEPKLVSKIKLSLAIPLLQMDLSNATQVTKEAKRIKDALYNPIHTINPFGPSGITTLDVKIKKKDQKRRSTGSGQH